MLLYISSRLGNICLGLASAEAWHAILYLVTPWQYLPRLGMYSLSCHALTVSAKTWHATLISYYALAVSAEAWHSILYLVTPWQYLPRLGTLAVSAEAWHSILYLVAPQQYLPRLGNSMLYLVRPWQYLPRLGMLFSILLRLGSICRGLAFYSISCHALAVSA